MPGLVASEGSLASYPWYLKPLIRSFAISVKTGAISALFAATSPEVRRHVEEYKAAYLTTDGSIMKTTAQATDAGLAAELWSLSEEIVAKIMDEKNMSNE